MTSQREQLQGLIAEIEAMLGKASPKLPWVVSNETAQQRKVLEKVYDYLQTLQQSGGALTDWQPSATGAPAADSEASAEASAGTVLQALLQEMQYLRSQMVQPLRSEISALQQERQALLEEVRQIELSRQQLQLPAPALDQANLDRLFQALAERLEGQLQYQIEQSVQRLNGEVANTQLLSEAALPIPELAEQLPQLSPAERLEQMKQLQRQSDELVLTLDTTLRAVFETLQQSVYSYQDSLSQGLDRMHTLGQQGEMMFNAMIAHLAQQMSQEGPTYLEARDRGDQPAQLPVSRQPAASPAEGLDQADESPASVNEDWDALEALNLDLDFEEDEEITIFQLDEELTQLQLDEPEEAPFALGADPEDVTVIQTGSSVEDARNEDLTDPLRLLNQLDEAAPDPQARVEIPTGETLPAESVEPISGEDRYQELDELYETLFGEDSISPEAPPESVQGVEPEANTDLELMSWEPEVEPEVATFALPSPEVDGFSADDLTADDLTANDPTADDFAGDDPTEGQPPVIEFTVDELAASEFPVNEFATDDLTVGDLTVGDLTETEFPVDPSIDDLTVGKPSASELTANELVENPFDVSGSDPYGDEPTLDTLLFDELIDLVSEVPAAETFDLADPTEPESFPVTEGEPANPLDEVFGADFSQSLMAEVEEETVVAETISSLAQLLPDETATFQSPRSDDSLNEAGFGLEEYRGAEDTFIPAAADEDLLATDDLEIGSSLGLEFGETTLEQLNADLSQLESQEDLAPTPQDGSEPPPESVGIELFPEVSPESFPEEPQNTLPQDFWLTAEPSPPVPASDLAASEASTQAVEGGFDSISESPAPADLDISLDQLFATSDDQDRSVESLAEVQPDAPMAAETPALGEDLQASFEQEGLVEPAVEVQPSDPAIDPAAPGDDLQSIVQELGLATAAEPPAVGESGLTLEDLLEPSEL
ncbi:MAG: hypothetical protein ICV62_19135, partial [Cyanobacteria bacterium Co-bin13]|nr:hypothetical protein [Cyanobacteria bacterium Co-bin13]